jgi:hypothetical protein
MKSLKLGDTIWADGYKAKVTKITDDGVVGLVLDEGLITEFHYECLLHDITLDDDDNEWELITESVPMIGDVIRINEKEYRLTDIDDGVVTLERGDEIRYYSFYDITWDIIDDYWVSSINEQVFSPTVRRKLKVYEVQDGVYLYNSLEELKEIYELLGEPHIAETYEKSKIDTLIDSLQYGYGLLHYWEDYDSDYDYIYKYMKVIQGGYIKGEL